MFTLCLQRLHVNADLKAKWSPVARVSMFFLLTTVSVVLAYVSILALSPSLFWMAVLTGVTGYDFLTSVLQLPWVNVK